MLPRRSSALLINFPRSNAIGCGRRAKRVRSSSAPASTVRNFEIAVVDSADCLIDAIPKKRGPKTDVLEALLKRVDGLEQRLKDEKKTHSTTDPSPVVVTREELTNGTTKPKRSHSQSTSAENESAVYSPIR